MHGELVEYIELYALRIALLLIMLGCLVSMTGCSGADSRIHTIEKGSTYSDPTIIDRDYSEDRASFDSFLICDVVRVIDGDTFVIDLNGEGRKVRLIGVDTPESVAPNEYLSVSSKENTEFGTEVSDFVKNLIEGQTVYLEFDVSTEDKYGRLLAYVYLSDGRMLQDILLENGYAELMTVPPNVKYVEHFTELLY